MEYGAATASRPAGAAPYVRSRQRRRPSLDMYMAPTPTHHQQQHHQHKPRATHDPISSTRNTETRRNIDMEFFSDSVSSFNEDLQQQQQQDDGQILAYAIPHSVEDGKIMSFTPRGQGEDGQIQSFKMSAPSTDPDTTGKTSKRSLTFDDLQESKSTQYSSTPKMAFAESCAHLSAEYANADGVIYEDFPVDREEARQRNASMTQDDTEPTFEEELDQRRPWRRGDNSSFELNDDGDRKRRWQMTPSEFNNDAKIQQPLNTTPSTLDMASDTASSVMDELFLAQSALQEQHTKSRNRYKTQEKVSSIPPVDQVKPISRRSTGEVKSPATAEPKQDRQETMLDNEKPEEIDESKRKSKKKPPKGKDEQANIEDKGGTKGEALEQEKKSKSNKKTEERKEADRKTKPTKKAEEENETEKKQKPTKKTEEVDETDKKAKPNKKIEGAETEKKSKPSKKTEEEAEPDKTSKSNKKAQGEEIQEVSGTKKSKSIKKVEDKEEKSRASKRSSGATSRSSVSPRKFREKDDNRTSGTSTTMEDFDVITLDQTRITVDSTLADTADEDAVVPKTKKKKKKKEKDGNRTEAEDGENTTKKSKSEENTEGTKKKKKSKSITTDDENTKEDGGGGEKKKTKKKKKKSLDEDEALTEDEKKSKKSKATEEDQVGDGESAPKKKKKKKKASIDGEESEVQDGESKKKKKKKKGALTDGEDEEKTSKKKSKAESELEDEEKTEVTDGDKKKKKKKKKGADEEGGTQVESATDEGQSKKGKRKSGRAAPPSNAGGIPGASNHSRRPSKATIDKYVIEDPEGMEYDVESQMHGVRQGRFDGYNGLNNSNTSSGLNGAAPMIAKYYEGRRSIQESFVDEDDFNSGPPSSLSRQNSFANTLAGTRADDPMYRSSHYTSPAPVVRNETVGVDSLGKQVKETCCSRRIMLILASLMVILILVLVGVGFFVLLGGTDPPEPTATPTGTPSFRPTWPERSSRAPTLSPTRPPTNNPTTTPTFSPKEYLQTTSIIGEEDGSLLGTAIGMTDDGEFMVVGMPQGDGGNGGVLTYRRSNTGAYERYGNTVAGGGTGSYFGVAVGISGNGQRIVVGAPLTITGGQAGGSVTVYQYSDQTNEWSQAGGSIVGATSGDQFGSAVDIAANGQRIAVGAPEASEVKVYQLSGNRWIQLGQALDGPNDSDSTGHSLALSPDGGTIAIGHLRSSINLMENGHVSVHKYDGFNGAWTELGSDIPGRASLDEAGRDVGLSTDGTRLVVGVTGFDQGLAADVGSCIVFDYDGSAWNQVGDPIAGDSPGDKAGHSVAISGDGEVVACGSADSGVGMYRFQSGAWKRIGDRLTKTSGIGFGFAVALNEDGATLVAGAPQFTRGRGSIFVFELEA